MIYQVKQLQTDGSSVTIGTIPSFSQPSDATTPYPQATSVEAFDPIMGSNIVLWDLNAPSDS
jgi:hypothetical protein